MLWPERLCLRRVRQLRCELLAPALCVCELYAAAVQLCKRSLQVVRQRAQAVLRMQAAEKQLGRVLAHVVREQQSQASEEREQRGVRLLADASWELGLPLELLHCFAVRRVLLAKAEEEVGQQREERRGTRG